MLLVCEDLKKKVTHSLSQALTDIDSFRVKKAGILKQIKGLGGEVDEEYLKNYPNISESGEEGNVDTLQMKASEIDLHIEEKQHFCEDQDHKASERKVIAFTYSGRKY